ncbi:MAG: 50S ribosomal protein L17 [Runella slithyformis]|nr:MAG: 50S ribosomal protein L17 [Runella slithyformis]
MKNNKKNNHLGRTSSHRSAMLSNMAASLIISKRIETTLAKAKELKKFVEPLITRSKEDSTHNRRVVFSNIQQKDVITELFTNVADKVADRPGGYTRIIKLGTRQGDNAEMCILELVDFNETMLAAVAEKATKTRRGRRSGKKSATESADVVVAETPKVQTQIVEAPVEVESSETEATQEIADDLEIVEGIGPKTAEALIAAGISTFAQLADANAETLREIISGISSKDPETWPQQAAMARDGKMAELKVWQDEMNSGKAEE